LGLLNGLRNRDLKNRLRNPVDEYWDRKLGVRTSGWHAGTGVPGTAESYMPFVASAYRDVFQYLRAANIGPDDVFVDLGSGYGRTVFAASWLGAKRAIGVELVQALTDGAEANRQRSKLRDRNIDFVCANALEFAAPDMTILYMFHPFGQTVLEQVLANIKATRDAATDPKPLRVVYANPVYDDALGQTGWLRKTAHLKPEKRPFASIGRFDMALWESV
jgi:SAM-dependent methyltransferase